MNDELNELADAAAYGKVLARRLVRVPKYHAITFGAYAIKVVALLVTILGVVIVVAVAQDAHLKLTFGIQPVALIPEFLFCGVYFVAALLLYMLGSLALAVRDMARNSFHLRNQ